MEEKKFSRIIRDYYFGNVSSGDDNGIKGEWFYSRNARGPKTIEELDDRRANESLYPTPRSNGTIVINL